MRPDSAAPPLPLAGWLNHLDELTAEDGYLEPLGQHHWAFFTDAAPVLLVSFGTMDELLARPVGQLPPLHQQAAAQGWSHLALLTAGPTWFRDPTVWRYFDRLIDDGFFDDFDRILFFGIGMGGYAAAAYSVAAPGARVLAIRPQATLSPTRAGWDRRFPHARRLDFTRRYGFAPAMVGGQQAVYLLHDPQVTADAMHVALFDDAPPVLRLDCPYLGPSPEVDLAAMQLLSQLIEQAMAGTLTPQGWATLWRARRDHLPWLRAMARQLEAGPRRQREAVFLRAALARFPDVGRLHRRAAELTAQGITLPPARVTEPLAATTEPG